VQLKNHTISADDNIRLAPEPLQFQWTFNPLILPSEILQHASHVDDELNNLKSSLKTLQNLTISDNQFPDLLSDNLSQVSTFSICCYDPPGGPEGPGVQVGTGIVKEAAIVET
jgi:hypothetical protein